jgi:hypothetical protein
MLLINIYVSSWASRELLATESDTGINVPRRPRAQAWPDFLPAPRNKRRGLLFPVSRDFPQRIGYRAIDSDPAGSCFRISAAHPLPVSEKLEA